MSKDMKVTDERVEHDSRVLKVPNFPIVDGQGLGKVENTTDNVAVKVNGLPIVVSKVDGERGLVELFFTPKKGSRVEVSYFYLNPEEEHSKAQ